MIVEVVMVGAAVVEPPPEALHIRLEITDSHFPEPAAVVHKEPSGTQPGGPLEQPVPLLLL